MASHCYLVGSSGELFIEYLVRHCALTDQNRSDLESTLNKRVEVQFPPFSSSLKQKIASDVHIFELPTMIAHYSIVCCYFGA